jgi:NAD(P)-dependent dehydrogenase (short-subunit alcohol dehydrogenase family)
MPVTPETEPWTALIDAGREDGRLVRQAYEGARAAELAPLRVAVSCAGVATPGRVVGRKGVLPLADFARVVEINLVGTFNLLRLAADAMGGNEPLDGDRGLVVMTASVAAFDGQVGQAAYAASKGGVAQLTKSLALAYASDGIRVNAIAPGPTLTGLTRASYTDAEARRATEALIPLGRLGEPDDLVGAVLFLASDESRWVTGSTVTVDGGYLAI